MAAIWSGEERSKLVPRSTDDGLAVGTLIVGVITVTRYDVSGLSSLFTFVLPRFCGTLCRSPGVILIMVAGPACARSPGRGLWTPSKLGHFDDRRGRRRFPASRMRGDCALRCDLAWKEEIRRKQSQRSSS